jgi:hypothetical protein
VIAKFKSNEFEPVFSGGTCLSKGYQLVQSFTEDLLAGLFLTFYSKPPVYEFDRSALIHFKRKLLPSPVKLHTAQIQDISPQNHLITATKHQSLTS